MSSGWSHTTRWLWFDDDNDDDDDDDDADDDGDDDDDDDDNDDDDDDDDENDENDDEHGMGKNAKLISNYSQRVESQLAYFLNL